MSKNAGAQQAGYFRYLVDNQEGLIHEIID
jgi:hypothetical protein